MRGLLVLPDRQLALGADNLLLIFDLETKEIITEIELSKDPKTTIFDIQVLPSEFELPPNSLQSKIERIVGFAGQNVLWEKESA